MSPGLAKILTEGLLDKMASLVWESVFALISVIAILVHPDRAKPLATAAPMPCGCQKATLYT
jgi:hypothetical protein